MKACSTDTQTSKPPGQLCHRLKALCPFLEGGGLRSFTPPSRLADFVPKEAQGIQPPRRGLKTRSSARAFICSSPSLLGAAGQGETSELLLTYQQVDAVQIGLLEQVLELQLHLRGFRSLAAGAGLPPQHLVQVEEGQLRVVLFLLWETGIQADKQRLQAGSWAPPARGCSRDWAAPPPRRAGAGSRRQLTEHAHWIDNISETATQRR